MKLMYLLICCLCFVNLSCGQSSLKGQEIQVVTVNTSVFYDERVGIIPLISAIRPLRAEFESEGSEFERRKAEVTKDIRNDIQQSIKQFAKEKGYIIVLSDSKDFIFDDTVDVTLEFIKFYHMSPKKK